MSDLIPALAATIQRIRTWRKRHAARIEAHVKTDPYYQFWCGGGLPPVDRKAVPARRRRKPVTP